jgi:serine/threonine-protein kinase
MEQQSMTSERWRQVKEIFQTAIDLPAAERAVYLTAVCVHAPSLQSEVESLIAAHEAPGDFLDAPAVDLAADSVFDARGDSLVGKSLGRYQILALLGRGGMGEVYRAKDATLGRDVAIKVLPADYACDPEKLQRFEQEARAASALNHPNIITIHEIGRADGIHFIVSEFIEGETLRRRGAREQLALDDILDLAIQIVGALNAAHEAGILHRDIKPENIMVRPDGLAKVLDFGLAKLIERPSLTTFDTNATTIRFKTEPGVIMGTMAYMSPEQVRGQVVDARADIFSLGVVLYEMTSGISPFARETAADVIASILEKDPPPLAQLRPDISEGFDRVVRKALCKNREERYQAVNDLLSDLKNLGSDDPAVAARTAKKDRLINRIIHRRHRRHRRHRLLIAAMIPVALIAAIIGVGYLGENHQEKKSIAVLPFINAAGGVGAAGNQEIDDLADGITETLINDLSQLSNLKVRPRNSVFRYKRPDFDPLAAGRELDVETVLTGQVGLRGDQFTISLELIDVYENRQLWGKSYRGRFADLRLTQSRIAREVTESLRLRLSPGEQQQIDKRHTDNPAAWQLYMLGRTHWNKRTGEGNRKAIELFNQSIDLDPAFALAHAGLADCYVLGGSYQLPAHEVMSRARAAALQALKLDESLAHAHTSLAQVKLFFDWDFVGAETSFKRAIELQPSYETSHHWYAIMLAVSGRFPEAIDRIKRAQEIDPVSPIITKDAGLIYYYAGEYDLALAQCRKTIDLSPDFYSAYSALGDIYLRMGRREESLAALRRADELSQGRLITKTALVSAYAASGQRDHALKLFRALRQESAGKPLPAFYQAVIYVSLGRKDAAFKSLNQAFQERSYRMVYLKVEPVFDSLRPDPRFTDLLRRMGFAPT